MIGMNGIQTAIALMSIDSLVKTALISMSEVLNITSEAKAAGIEYFLQKPILSSALHEMFMDIQNITNEKILTLTELLPDFSDKSFLIVEDSEINREIARFILEEAGANVDEAENGEIAVHKYMKNPFIYDCILMDVQMPVMDGYTASLKIRESMISGCTKIPIIAMTANVFNDDVNEAYNAKMNAHIRKPINTKEMYKTIDKILKERENDT